VDSRDACRAGGGTAGSRRSLRRVAGAGWTGIRAVRVVAVESVSLTRIDFFTASDGLPYGRGVVVAVYRCSRFRDVHCPKAARALDDGGAGLGAAEAFSPPSLLDCLLGASNRRPREGCLEL
jgi:hypothetical protein